MARDNSIEKDRTTDLGVVRINNDVIAAIASISAMEVRGVHRMGGGIGRTVAEMLSRKSNTKGVRIEMVDNEVKLVIAIVVDYGVDIPKIADEVQESVKRSVEKMTGLILSEVDVVVEGVHSPSSAADKAKKIP